MSTVRNIERRMFIRRQLDRDLQTAGTAAAPTAREWGVDWNGIWAGYMVWVGVEVVLLSLVLGIGFSSVNPLLASSWAGMGRGVVIWAVIVTLISTFIGAWVAGRTPAATRRRGIAKGVTLWGLIVLSVIMVVGWAAGRATMVAAGAAGAVGTAAPAAMQTGITQLQGVLQSNGINVTRAQTAEIATRLAGGDQAGAADALSRDAGISTTQATTILNQVTAGPSSAAAGMGQRAAGAVKQGGVSATWGMFWLSLITLGCAVAGGAAGGSGMSLKRATRLAPAA